MFLTLSVSISHVFARADILVMASIPLQRLRLNAQSPRILRSMSKKHSYSLCQQPTRLKHRPSLIIATCVPTGTRSRIFMSSSSHKQPASIGMEWYELSTERKIQWLLNSGDTKWGWVIYRCTYKPELQGAWESFKDLVEHRTRNAVEHSDAPDIAEKLDWAWVEDHKLEDAPLSELKRRFRTWVRTDMQDSNVVYDTCTATYSLGSRYSYFIQVDEESLTSCFRESCVDLDGGHVNIVRGWVDPLVPEEAACESDDTLDTEDWMKIRANMMDPQFYIELDNNESWYAHYSPPPHLRCW
jgi:hypothetical protein